MLADFYWKPNTVFTALLSFDVGLFDLCIHCRQLHATAPVTEQWRSTHACELYFVAPRGCITLSLHHNNIRNHHTALVFSLNQFQLQNLVTFAMVSCSRLVIPSEWQFYSKSSINSVAHRRGLRVKHEPAQMQACSFFALLPSWLRVQRSCTESTLSRSLIHKGLP